MRPMAPRSCCQRARQGLGLLADFGEFFLDDFEALARGFVLLALEGGLLDFEGGGLAFEVVDLGGDGADLVGERGGGLVDQVDGLVGEEAVGDVAVGERGGGDDGGVLDADLVVRLVALAQAAQDGDGVFDVGLADVDELEAALEGGVLLDVLAVLVEGGRADGAQAAAGERGLEHVAGVHGAFGRARADEGVQLVDEEDDLAVGVFDLLEQGLEAVFELAAVLGSGDHAGEVEGDDALVFQYLRDIAVDDAPGEALDDGGLADAGFADEDGVVLGAAGEDLDDAADLFVAADDGVELALAREVGEVFAVLFEGLELGLGVLVGDALRSAHGGESLQDGVVGCAHGGESVAGRGRDLASVRASRRCSVEMKSSLKESASLAARSRTFCREAAMAGWALAPETLGSLAMAALAPARSCCTRTPAPSRTGRTTPSRSSSSAASRCMGRTSGLPFSAARDAAAWTACCDLTVSFSHLNGMTLPLMQMDGERIWLALRVRSNAIWN